MKIFRHIVPELPRELRLSSEPGDYGLTNLKKILLLSQTQLIYV